MRLGDLLLCASLLVAALLWRYDRIDGATMMAFSLGTLAGDMLTERRRMG